MCKILLVDNNHTNINFIKSSLYESLKNYIIIESNNHNDLINNLEKQKFDIVIVNITNNFISYEDIIFAAQKQDINLPVIFYYNQIICIETISEAILSGAIDVINLDNIDILLNIISREIIEFDNKQTQILKLEKANQILMKLAKAVNWIMQNSIHDISFQKLLTSFGNLMGVDRAYIFERIKYKNNCNYILKAEWCNDNINGRCKFQQYNSINCDLQSTLIESIERKKTIYGLLEDLSNEDKKIMDCHNIKSLACVPILKPNQDVWGFFGFDDCTTPRIWSELEINALEMFGAILGTIVFKIETYKNEEEKISVQTNNLRLARLQIEQSIEATNQSLLRRSITISN